MPVILLEYSQNATPLKSGFRETENLKDLNALTLDLRYCSSSCRSQRFRKNLTKFQNYRPQKDNQTAMKQFESNCNQRFKHEDD